MTKTAWIIQDVDYEEDSDGSIQPLAVALDREAAERVLVRVVAELGTDLADDPMVYDGGSVIEYPVPGHPHLTRIVWSHEVLEGSEIWLQEYDVDD
jgi:hypothetical protein